MRSDSIKKTLIVAVGVCLVCSVFVSTATVVLKDRQDENKKLDKLKNILIAGHLYTNDNQVNQIFSDKIKYSVVDLEKGSELKDTEIPSFATAENFDIKKLSDDKKFGKQINPDLDIAKIRKIPKIMSIYKVVEEGQPVTYILPVYGKGLWSTMWGFLAIKKDFKTVAGITFYEHGETPGLGGEIDNVKWKRSWEGKAAFNEKGEIILEVIKSKVDSSNPKANSQIDGLSGSTLTTRGVDNMIKFWLGENGYGKYIANLRGGNGE